MLLIVTSWILDGQIENMFNQQCEIHKKQLDEAVNEIKELLENLPDHNIDSN